MEHHDLTHYHTLLTEQLAVITGELSSSAIHNDVSDDWEAIPPTDETSEADENSEADGVETWNERRATVAALEQQYRAIKYALAKLARGTYGVCEISGEPIETERLAAYPAARTCLAHRHEENSLPY